MTNPIDVSNNKNRFNLDYTLSKSKLILKEEVKTLLKDKFFLNGEEKSSVKSITKKLIKVNIVLIYVLILMFLSSLMNEFKITITPIMIMIRYHLYCTKVFLTLVNNDDINIMIFMVFIKSESTLLFYIYKLIKLSETAIINKLKEYFHGEKVKDWYIFKSISQSFLSYIPRKSWYWIIPICNNTLTWKFPELDRVIVIIIISFLIEVIWGICSYLLNISYLKKKFSYKDLFISISICLLFWIKFIIEL